MCLLVTAVTPVAGNTDPNPFPATPFVTYINDLCMAITFVARLLVNLSF